MKATYFVQLSCLVAGLVGCSRVPDLAPAQAASTATNLEDAAVAAEDGVSVTAQAPSWPGPVYIEGQVTPVRVIVRNESSVPRAVRYESFKLVADDGQTYSSLPPIQLGEDDASESYIQPGFVHRGFHPFLSHSRAYQIPPYSGPLESDPTYYHVHYPYWETTPNLPTIGMLERALPEGVVEPGGMVDGFLYFERVQERAGTALELQMVFPATRPDNPTTRLSIPFVVDS